MLVVNLLPWRFASVAMPSLLVGRLVVPSRDRKKSQQWKQLRVEIHVIQAQQMQSTNEGCSYFTLDISCQTCKNHSKYQLKFYASRLEDIKTDQIFLFIGEYLVSNWVGASRPNSSWSTKGENHSKQRPPRGRRPRYITPVHTPLFTCPFFGNICPKFRSNMPENAPFEHLA